MKPCAGLPEVVTSSACPRVDVGVPVFFLRGDVGALVVGFLALVRVRAEIVHEPLAEGEAGAAAGCEAFELAVDAQVGGNEAVEVGIGSAEALDIPVGEVAGDVEEDLVL